MRSNKFIEQLSCASIMIAVFLFGAGTLSAQITLISSETVDDPFTDSNGVSHGQSNGRLNAIRLKTNTELNGDFSGFRVFVSGYEVKAYYLDALKKDIFVELEEGPVPDTAATPSFIVQNTTLADAAGGTSLLRIVSSITPDDKARPVVAHTLCVAGQKELFIQFSEKIEGTPSAWNSSGSVRYTNISSSKTDLIEKLEYVYESNTPFSVSDIINSTIRIGSTVQDSSGNSMTSRRFRLTSLILGASGEEAVLPTTAAPVATAGGSGSIVDNFDGTATLETTAFFLNTSVKQAAVSEGINPVSSVELAYAFDVGERYRNKQGLWLPSIKNGEPVALGLVPRILSTFNSNLPDTPQAGSRIQKYRVVSLRSASDGAKMEFFFRLNGNHIAARILDATAPNWYRGVRPWVLNIQKPFAKQAGGVSILGNVVDVTKGGKTALVYTTGSSGAVTVQVIDLSGKIVKVLQRGTKQAGTHRATWDGKNGSGENVARGIYFIRIVGPGGLDQIRKVLVVK